MKKTIVMLLCILVLAFTALDIEARPRKAKIKVNVYDHDTSRIIEGVEVTIETTVQIITQYTDGTGKTKFKIKKTKHELPVIHAKKKGYLPYTGSLERNAAGNIILKLKKQEKTHDFKKQKIKYTYAFYRHRSDRYADHRFRVRRV